MLLIKNKKGVTTFALILVIFVAFFIMVFAVAMSYGFGFVDEAFLTIGASANIGNTSILENYQDTLQPGILAMKTTVPQIVSTSVLLGMVLTMLLVGWKVKEVNQIWILLDIIILIIAEILAFIITGNFTNFINSNESFVAIARDVLPLGAKYILNLVIIIPIVGVLMMLGTYFRSRSKKEEEFVN